MDKRGAGVSRHHAARVHPDQSGVVSRRQLLDLGLEPHDIRRRVRRRELTVIHRGVYVDHTGPPTWLQRAWAAVLFAWPAALCEEAVLRAEGIGARSDDGPIRIAIDESRRVTAPGGVELRRVLDLPSRARWHLSPPRLSVEDAVLQVAARQRRELDAVAVLADAVGSRRTTAARLRSELAGLPRLRRRAWMDDVLDDVATGVHSVLEHGYLTRVERAHALPRGRRQVRHAGLDGVRYRDVETDGLVVIELDGRLHHASTRQRDRDLDRDLEAAVDARLTVRLGWGQVFDRPCQTADRLAVLFGLRGWTGAARPCSAECALHHRSIRATP